MPAEADLFNPRHYAAVRRPLLDAETLPAWCYTSPAFYRREVERIFMKVWNFVGSVHQIPNPGDYFTLTFVGVPLIILRDGTGAIRRLRQLPAPRLGALCGEGSCKLIVCPIIAEPMTRWSVARCTRDGQTHDRQVEAWPHSDQGR